MIAIYKITNKINGKVYIGQSVNVESRWKDHIFQLKNNLHHNAYLQSAWNKGVTHSEKTRKIISEKSKNKMWINNGTELKRIYNYQQIPKGWSKGIGKCRKHQKQD